MFEQQGARDAGLSIMDLASQVHYEKVIEAMRKAPDKHPESYVRLVESRWHMMRGFLAEAAEALCMSQPVDDLCEQYRYEIVEALFPLLLCDQGFLQDHQKFIAVADLYIQSTIKSTTDASIKALLQALGVQITQQKSMQPSSEPAVQDQGIVLEGIKVLVGSIDAFSQSSAHLTTKEKLPRDVALILL
jgi:hypothetical protein